MTADWALPQTVLLKPFRPVAPALGPLLVGVAYYCGAEAAFAIGTLTQMFAPFWPPNVVLLCALLLAPQRRWWAYVLAAFAAHLAAERGVAMPVPQLLMAFACNVAVALLSAVLLRRALTGPPWLGDLRKASLYLLITVMLSPGLVAFAGGAEPTFGDGDASNYWTFWWRWYLSNALGSLTLTPVALTWLTESTHSLRIAPRRRRIEAAALALGLTAACTIAFGAPTELADRFLPALLYVPVPLLLWAAVRFGGKGASGAILLVTVLSLWQAMQGHGPFAATAPRQSVLALQLFLAVIAAPVILLAAIVEELRRTNNRLAAVLDGISDCYYTVGRDWRFTVVNPKAAAWLGGRSPEAMVGRNFQQTLTDAAPGVPLVRRAMDEGTAVHGEIASATQQGKWIDLHVYPSADGVSVFFRDITKRKAAEASLRESEERFRAMAETVPGILFASSAQGGCDYLSPRFHEYTGLTAEAASGLGWAEALHPDDKKRILAARQLAAPSGESFAEECRIRAADGTYRWFVARWRPIHDAVGRTHRWFGAITDIDELKRGAEELRTLTGQLLAAQDGERRRIARDLHDSTAQNLAAVSLNISQALRLAPDIVVPATIALQESCQLIEQSQREIRTLTYLLHPPMLDEAGLPSALGWYVEGFSKRSGIAVSLAIAPELTERRLLTEVETALFRVVQEGLSNVRRHSGSSTARIHLALEQAPPSGESVVTLEIADAGRGMSKDAGDRIFAGSKSGDGARTALGVGVASMRERVRQLGGRLEIQSNGHGMSVRAIVPLVDKHAETPAENPTLNEGRAHISPPALRVRS
jgi:PAS domain S-box-containing protein